VPLFGLCLGHQIIALAAGARTYKLPFGHHGGNHPVQERASGRIEITAQNHNYAVAVDSLEGLPLEVTRVNLYDGTVEGLRHLELPVVTVQYHPEASPGPHDSLYVLHDFVASLTRSGR
jgi:carbamoyl-phosphate synthase small subunit